MNLTYILIDYENVKPTAAILTLIRGEEYRVRIFHGPHQNNFGKEILNALLPVGPQVELVQGERVGKNALDFHIAFYLGRLVQELEAAETPPKRSASFYVVSKDGGFDVLLDHIRQLGYHAARITNIPEALGMSEPTYAVAPPKPAGKIPLARKPAAKAQPEAKIAKAAMPPSTKVEKPDAWSRTIENLRDHPNNRPTTSKSLERHVASLLGKDTSPDVVKSLIARLAREGVAVLKGKKIEYRIPDVRE